MLSITPYAPDYQPAIRALLERIGWEERYIVGQLDSVEAFARDGENSRVFVALQESFAGFVTMQFYAWNRLAQLHGLAVAPDMRRQGVAAGLVKQAESFAREKGGRGVYVDTPVNNAAARAFYESQGYRQDYIMTAYYADELDGVTFLKLFTRSLP